MYNYPKTLQITLQFDKVNHSNCQRYSNRFCFVALAFLDETEYLNKVFNNSLDFVFVSPFFETVAFHFNDSCVIYGLTQDLVEIAREFDAHGFDSVKISELSTKLYNLVKIEK